MSKHGKERKVNDLSALATVVDVANLPEAPAEGVQELTEVSAAPAMDIPVVEEQPAEVQPEIPAPAEPETAPPAVEVVAEPATPVVVDEVKVDPLAVETVDPLAGIPAEARAIIEGLTSQIAALKSAKSKRRVASGSKARPNTTYTLLTRPPAWTGTPQIGQLMNILFDPTFVEAHKSADGTVKVSEPELFAQVEAGHAAGILRTTQKPVRIFQYYRNDLLRADCLLWK